MPIAVFQIVSKDLRIEKIGDKLSRVRDTKEYDYAPTGDEVPLMISIANVTKATGKVTGTLMYEFLDTYKKMDGSYNYVIKSNTVQFAFVQTNDIYLLVSGPSADKSVLKLSKMAFKQIEDPVIKCQIRPGDMDKFLEDNRHEIIRCNWDELRIPTLNKAALYGSDMEDSQQFRSFDRSGQKNSITVRLLDLGVTISMKRMASVHIYSRTDFDDAIVFITTHIIPLCK